MGSTVVEINPACVDKRAAGVAAPESICATLSALKSTLDTLLLIGSVIVMRV